MAEFASKGVAGSGLGLGIAGTALGLLNTSGNGLLGNLFNTAHNCGCSENTPVNRYELGQEQRIADLTASNRLLEATIYTDGKLNDFRNYVDNKFSAVDARINAQDVFNATTNSTLGCIANQLAVLNSITKTVVPITAVCPEPMKLYNSWTAPTTTTAGA
jgi:hypothetical protein